MAGKQIAEVACCSRCGGLLRVRQLSVDVVAIVNQWIDARAQQLATAAGVGAVLALNLGHMDLPIIDIILLIGIVKKNGIMLVDFAIVVERERHMPPITAIREACLPRLRPILMATAAALLAGVPMMFGHRTGSELRRPLGHSIVGGLALSQVLSLYTTPAVLSLPRPAQAWIQGRRALKPPQAADIPGIAAQ
jgi:predicted RND superfamily exporter protein